MSTDTKTHMPMDSSLTASSSTTDAPLTKGDVESASSRENSSLWQYLLADVDAGQTTWQLAAYCFMTGYVYVEVFLPHIGT